MEAQAAPDSACGGKQLVHFVAHGDFKSAQPNESSILLSDGRYLRAQDLHGPIQSRLMRDRPLVFLNSCRVGSQNWSLTGLGGWAERWVRRCGDDDATRVVLFGCVHPRGSVIPATVRPNESRVCVDG